MMKSAWGTMRLTFQTDGSFDFDLFIEDTDIPR